MLFIDLESSWQFVQIIITSILGIFSLAAALNGHLVTRIPIILRVILFGGGLMMVYPGTVTDLTGFAILALTIGFQVLQARKQGIPVSF